VYIGENVPGHSILKLEIKGWGNDNESKGMHLCYAKQGNCAHGKVR
jgi:hypothetical protein